MTSTRTPVTREAIVGTALELLAEGGLEGVSFRRIATRLGVSAPTLYWHVDSKRHLMDLMAEELLRRTNRDHAGPRHGQPWWEWLRADAQQMFEALIATRDAPRVVAGNRPSPESFAGIEQVLGVLAQAGMTPGQAQNALFAIGAYVIGSAVEWQAEADRQAGPADPTTSDQERADALAGRPFLLAAMAERVGAAHSATFEYGLDLLIDGLRARHVPPS